MPTKSYKQQVLDERQARENGQVDIFTVIGNKKENEPND